MTTQVAAPAAAPEAPPPAAPAAAPAAPPAKPPSALAEAVAETPAAAPPPPAAAGTAPPPPAAPAPIELKVPEGFVVEPAQLETVKKLFAETGLDTAKAQKVFDSYVELEKAKTKAAEDSFAALDAKWAAELAADPEWAGEKRVVAQQAVKRVVTKFPEAKTALELITRIGYGNHPAMVRLFAAVGRSLGEDSVAGTSQAAGGKLPAKPLHEILYPNMQKASPK